MLRLQSHSRNTDFINLCLALLQEPGNDRLTVSELVDLALEKRAKCYYIDFYRASPILKHALMTGSLPFARSTSLEMWRDMLADLRHLVERYPRQNVGELILRLCMGSAGNPRYYISRRRALALIRPHVRLVAA